MTSSLGDKSKLTTSISNRQGQKVINSEPSVCNNSGNNSDKHLKDYNVKIIFLFIRLMYLRELQRILIISNIYQNPKVIF